MVEENRQFSFFSPGWQSYESYEDFFDQSTPLKFVEGEYVPTYAGASAIFHDISPGRRTAEFCKLIALYEPESDNSINRFVSALPIA